MLEDYFAHLEDQVDAERERVEAALETCRRQGLRVVLTESRGRCRVQLEREAEQASCEAPTLSGALIGALLAFRRRVPS